MNIGFVTFFAFRPHVEHVFALSEMAKEQGHRVFFLSCDSALSSCYRREITKSSRVECVKCTIGGLRSYAKSNVTSALGLKDNPDKTNVDYSGWGHSSSCTLLRTESDEDKARPEFVELKTRLSEAAHEAFNITRAWIGKEKLDAIVCFNGRMDATRGVMEAARFSKTTFVSVERAFGDGLLLLPNIDCLGLEEIHRVVSEYRQYPLSQDQAARAAKVVVSRFLKKNVTEWRAYNLDSVDKEWPLKGEKKILILPSSFNELDGHPDWQIKWRDQFHAFTSVVRDLGFSSSSYVMRGHPNWSERIGATGGEEIEKQYKKWAEQNGILYIPGASNISTKNLIAQADILILNGGSAAFEGGLLGKQIISLVNANYKFAGFVVNYLSEEDRSNLATLQQHNPREIIRLTLRFLYSWCFRAMQFTNEFRALDSIHYQYSAKTSGEKLLKIISTGMLHPDDPSYADNTAGEEHIINLIINHEWEKVYDYPMNDDRPPERKFKRRFMFRFIDDFRALFPSGDR
jgi:hypothetical protein